jgi:hypothetical protein
MQKEIEQVEEDKLRNYQALQLLLRNNNRIPLPTPLSIDFDGSEEEVTNRPIKQDQYLNRVDTIRLKNK